MTRENDCYVPTETQMQFAYDEHYDRTIFTLLRVGTRRCRLAAALLAVIVALAPQFGARASAEEGATLYLNAPSVSHERASQAGEVARDYSEGGSSARDGVLAWVGVPARALDAPDGASEAFASITAPEGEGASDVTLEDALRAGEVMLAQIGDEPPEDGEDGNEELASAAEAVRPQLGDGRRAPETEEGETREKGPAFDETSPSDRGVSAYASTQGASVSIGETGGEIGEVAQAPQPIGGGEPDGSLQVPSIELASAPTVADEAPGSDAGAEEEAYGPTGPISNAPRAPESSEEDDTRGEQTYPGESALLEITTDSRDAGSDEPEPTEPTTRAEAEPNVEGAGPTDGREDEIALVPVTPAEEGTEAEETNEPAQEPSPATPSTDDEPEAVDSEPPPADEAPEEPPVETGVPEAAPAEVPTETGDGQVEIVVEEPSAEALSSQEEPPTETATSEAQYGQPTEEQYVPEPAQAEGAPPPEEPLDGEGAGPAGSHSPAGAGQYSVEEGFQVEEPPVDDEPAMDEYPEAESSAEERPPSAPDEQYGALQYQYGEQQSVSEDSPAPQETGRYESGNGDLRYDDGLADGEYPGAAGPVELDEQQAEGTDGGTTVVQESTQQLSAPAGGEATAHQEQTALVRTGQSYEESAESTEAPPAPGTGQTAEVAEGETQSSGDPTHGRPEEMSRIPEEPAPMVESGTTGEPTDGAAAGERQASEPGSLAELAVQDGEGSSVPQPNSEQDTEDPQAEGPLGSGRPEDER